MDVENSAPSVVTLAPAADAGQAEPLNHWHDAERKSHMISENRER
jgi:hypothetical protein